MWMRIVWSWSLKSFSTRLSIAYPRVSVITFRRFSSWKIIKEISSMVRICTPIDPIAVSFVSRCKLITSKLAAKASPSISLNL
jgi:hypothetical protein